MALTSGCARRRRRSVEGILRPRVLRIAPAHLLADLGIGAAPEAGQIGRHRQRPAGRGEQVQYQRHPPAGQTRRVALSQ
jgi:hypothetical protein